MDKSVRQRTKRACFNRTPLNCSPLGGEQFSWAASFSVLCRFIFLVMIMMMIYYIKFAHWDKWIPVLHQSYFLMFPVCDFHSKLKEKNVKQVSNLKTYTHINWIKNNIEFLWIHNLFLYAIKKITMVMSRPHVFRNQCRGNVVATLMHALQF